MTTTGAKPPGANDEASAAAAVREMFDAIAPRYDLLNHVLSANVDRLWWWRAARRFRAVLANPDAAVLDICCGTGDMTMALLKRRPREARPIVAADFSSAMLSRGAKKFGGPGVGARAEGLPYAVPMEADALHLPLEDASMDLTQGVSSRAETRWTVGDSRFQRAGRADRQGLRRLLPPRSAGDWAGDLRPGGGV
jgi:demethylmenaquinone methyltransferase/2-methoxy-6-polyprenyl-1,4-benzoquinol methylase